jgi:hypothetical protein
MQIGGVVGVIKNVYRGTISMLGGQTSNTATIPSVNMAKTEVRMLGCVTNSNTVDQASCKVKLTDSTTLTASRGAGATYYCNVEYEVTEYY